MRALIAEDDFASRKFLANFLKKYGEVDITVDGEEAVYAFRYALEERDYYDLVCLDVMMPHMDGIQALRLMREMEDGLELPEEKCAKIIMTTALNEVDQVQEAFDFGCEGYAAKPIDVKAFCQVLVRMGLIDHE